MDKQTRDEFLTEAMGNCWHEWSQEIQHTCCNASLGYVKCLHCSATTPSLWRETRPSFSGWEAFGQLWEWAQKQEWWTNYLLSPHSYCEKVHCDCGCGDAAFNNHIIHPDRFADAIYSYLAE